MSNVQQTGAVTGGSLVRIAIFASGAGSNAKRLIEHFEHHPAARVALVVCNKEGAGVLQHASHHQVPVVLIEKERFLRGDGYVPELLSHGINFIVLAGFLWKVPDTVLNAFPGAIVNIHPALLPKYGGKGMYGAHVHRAVLTNGDTESGITIHWVDGQYDHGAHIFQATCTVEATDTPESLAAKIHALEHQHFPAIVEKCIVEKFAWQ